MYMTGTSRSPTLEGITISYKHFRENKTRYGFAIRLLDNNQIIGD